MPLWQLLAAGAGAYIALAAVLIGAGARWQTVKPRADHTPPTTPEEGNR